MKSEVRAFQLDSSRELRATIKTESDRYSRIEQYDDGRRKANGLFDMLISRLRTYSATLSTIITLL